MRATLPIPPAAQPPTEPIWGHALTAAAWVALLIVVVALFVRTCGPSSADVERQWEESFRRDTAEDGGE